MEKGKTMQEETQELPDDYKTDEDETWEQINNGTLPDDEKPEEDED